VPGKKKKRLLRTKIGQKPKAALSPDEIASQILADIKDSHGSLLRDFVDVSRPFSTFDLPAAGVGEIHEDIFRARQ
jgi:hypothetical protein